MKERKIWRNGIKIAWLLFNVISILIWLPSLDRLFTQDHVLTSRYISLDDGWDIVINDSSYQDVSLDDFRFEAVNIGDTITMKRKLPDNWEITQGALRFHIRHSAVRVYIDSQRVYDYGYERISENKTVGSGLQFINFPDEYKGKDLRIDFDLAEDNAFTKLDSVRIYGWENAYRSLLTENRIPLLFGCFLVIFGFSTMLITAFALLFSMKYVRILCISAFCMCMGLWTLCYYNVILMFAIPLYSVSLLEYVALYLSPVPLIIYMYDNVKNTKNKILKYIYWVLFMVQILFNITVMALHAKDIVHFAAVLKYFQVLIVCHLAYFIIIDVINLKSSHLMNRMYLIGLLVVAGCTGYDLFTYYEQRYYAKSVASIRGLSAVGMMVFVFILIISFYMNLAYRMMEEAERNSLLKSAYTDELTKLHNRRYCSEHMEQINRDKTKDYTVVCFDLNNLKVINDTYGHAKGDLLIKSAADVIGETFEKHGFVGRMGGDEFIAVLLTSAKKEIEAWMEQFQENIAKKNREVKDLNMSISYGYALSDELPEKDIEKVYQQADDRMYEYKKQYKLRTGAERGVAPKGI